MGNARPDQGAMSLQLLIVPFVVIAFVAIVWRFLPRAEDGSIRLPRLIDESVGMWVIRSALGRATDSADPDDIIPEPAEDEIAYRIGVPGAPPPTVPTRVVVSHAPSKAEPVLSPSPQGDVSAGRRRTRPTGAPAALRRRRRRSQATRRHRRDRRRPLAVHIPVPRWRLRDGSCYTAAALSGRP